MDGLRVGAKFGLITIGYGLDMVIGIQYLRALAVLLVILHHIASLFPIGEFRFFLGTVGVDIFFVISGFIMWVTTGPDTSGWEFFKRRIARIVPLYFLVTVYFSFVDTSRGLDFGFHPEPINFIKSLLFIPFENPTINDLVMPIVRIGWTLNMEMFFYLIFAIGLFLPIRFRIAWVALIFSAVIVFATRVDHGSSIIDFYGSTIVLEFLAGMGLGWLYKNGHLKENAYFVYLAILVFVGKMVFKPIIFDDRFLDLGLVSIVLVAGVLSYEQTISRRPFRGLLLVGNASYSMYLTHKIFIVLAFSATFKGLFPSSPLYAWPILLVMATIGGIICYLIVERPASGFAKRMLVS